MSDDEGAPRPLYAQSAAEMPGLSEIGAMSGLEYIEAIRAGRMPAAPIARTLGFTMHEVDDGRVVFRGVPEFAVYNPIGTVHGGWFGVLLDSAMGCAVHTTLPKGTGYTTLEYKVNIVRPIFEGTGPVLAIGEVSHRGRRTGVAEGRIVGEADGRLYATASTTCLLLPME